MVSTRRTIAALVGVAGLVGVIVLVRGSDGRDAKGARADHGGTVLAGERRRPSGRASSRPERPSGESPPALQLAQPDRPVLPARNPEAELEPASEAGATALESNPVLDRQAVAEQARISEYLHKDVIPRVRSCYSKLSPGKVELTYRFIPGADSRWRIESEGVELHDSTLPADEDKIALQCMRDAVAGTSFPMVPEEAAEEGWQVYWTWHTPARPEAP